VHQAVCHVISPRRAIAAKQGERSRAAEAAKRERGRGRAAEAAEWRVAMGHQVVPRPGGRATEAALERGNSRISPRPGPSWTYQHDNGQTI